jgi:hypothetical protein
MKIEINLHTSAISDIEFNRNPSGDSPVVTCVQIDTAYPICHQFTYDCKMLIYCGQKLLSSPRLMFRLTGSREATLNPVERATEAICYRGLRCRPRLPILTDRTN